MKVKIVYFSGTGNTKDMATFIDRYFVELGHEVICQSIEEVDEDVEADIFCLGCPAYGVEDIEAYEFRPYYESLKPHMKNKKVILFGSYDWGEGKWMHNWVKETEDAGIAVDCALPVELTPNNDDFAEMKRKLDNVNFS